VRAVLLLLLFVLSGLFHVSAAVIPAPENRIWEFSNVGCDAVGLTNVGYDGSGKFSSAYDVASSRAQTDNERRSETQRASFASFVRFLAAEGAETGATAPVGRLGNPMEIAPGTNTPTTINGIDYSAHALDQMQGRGIVPSVVQNTIKNGTTFTTRVGTTGYYDAVNNVRVIVNSQTGKVVTVIPGAP
jgi:hypothetical protein